LADFFSTHIDLRSTQTMGAISPDIRGLVAERQTLISEEKDERKQRIEKAKLIMQAKAANVGLQYYLNSLDDKFDRSSAEDGVASNAWWMNGDEKKDGHWTPIADPWGLMTSRTTAAPLAALVTNLEAKTITQEQPVMAGMLGGHAQSLWADDSHCDLSGIPGWVSHNPHRVDSTQIRRKHSRIEAAWRVLLHRMTCPGPDGFSFDSYESLGGLIAGGHCSLSESLQQPQPHPTAPICGQNACADDPPLGTVYKESMLGRNEYSDTDLYNLMKKATLVTEQGVAASSLDDTRQIQVSQVRKRTNVDLNADLMTRVYEGWGLGCKNGWGRATRWSSNTLFVIGQTSKVGKVLPL
jgi:hypothetical protein